MTNSLKIVLINVALILSVILGMTCSEAFAQSNSEKLSVIDKNQHSKEQFQTIVNILKKHHPECSEELLAGYIAYAYGRLREEFPDITIHDVALGILDNSKLLVGKADIKEIVALYISSYATERTYNPQ